MYTAGDVLEYLHLQEGELSERLDFFIKGNLQVLFLQANPIKVACSFVPFEENFFIKAMGIRGFSVTEECEDRPCTYPKYTIGIPPKKV